MVDDRQARPTIARAQLISALLFALVVSGCSNGPVTSGNGQPYQGTELNGITPDFRLKDQNEVFVSLSDFRGMIVVLTFMDSQCKDVCPLTAAQLRETYRQLSSDEASRVAFLAVNVNADANTVADVYYATQEWRLMEIPCWHFMTGDRDELRSVWNAFAVAVVPDPDEILHTPGVYIIDPSGQQRWYISIPSSEEGSPQFALPLNKLLITHIRELLKEKK